MKHEPVSLDLGTIQVKFVNGRWVEGTSLLDEVSQWSNDLCMLAGNLNPMEGRALTVEEENRELHQRLTKLSSENNMLKYRNEVLMQMVCPQARCCPSHRVLPAAHCRPSRPRKVSKSAR